MNDTAVTEEVNRIKNRPNLLLWFVTVIFLEGLSIATRNRYTGDEPDGTSGEDRFVSVTYQSAQAHTRSS